jgi:hypothetical protein
VIDRRSLEIGAWLTLTADGSALLLPSGPYYHHVLH